MQTIAHKFNTLKHIIAHAQKVLLVAHSRPDPDTIGATVALYHFLSAKNIPTTLACSDAFPSAFDSFLPQYRLTPLSEVNIDEFDIIIGADNIDRGFHTVLAQASQEKITVGIDHHLHTNLSPDLLITNAQASSTCEILYDFFASIDHTLTEGEASALIVGILGDTRLFHNPNTSSHVLDVTADLIDAQAPLSKIMHLSFLKKPIETLHIWGIALKNARRMTPSGIIISAITQEQIATSNIPTSDLKEEVKEVASLLCSVPHVPFAVILMQIDDNIIKGSIRAERTSDVDTTGVARLFGGGGHKLASGFEIAGTLKVNGNTWQVV